MNKKSLSVDSVITKKARANLKRLPDGTINLSNIFNSTEKKDTITNIEDTTSEKFFYMINSIKLSDYSIAFQDQVTFDTTDFLLDHINLSITDLTNQKNVRSGIKFSSVLNSKGKLGANGSLSLEPLSSNLQIDFRNISIKPAQVYLADLLNIALTGGELNVRGKFDFSQGSQKEFKADYKGNIQINDFATINKENADDFLLLKSLKLRDLDFSLDPLRIDIKEVGVTELYSLFNIYADGTTNLQAVLKKDTTKQNSVARVKQISSESGIVNTSSTNDNKNIRIENVILEKCNINFSDHRFKNVFHANMKELNGKITGLSADPNIVADVAIEGKYDGISPIIIDGKANPLAEDLFIDIGLNFKDLDLTLMNPYSQKYLGYGIKKGKLSLDLKYLLKDKKLDSENNIYLDQLTLGEAVKSPEATNLPVKFALALLKDKNGDIKLDVPITGSLDDPKFNIGRILLQVLGNVITKAVTSPFTALSSLFGGSEELSYIEFKNGSSKIDNKAIEKLDKVSKGLLQRDDLIIEIQGFADSIIDSEGLKKENFDRKMKAIKLKDMLRKSDKIFSTDSVTILPEEYARYLEKVYDTENFEKPKSKLGFTKSITVPEKEKLIYNNIIIKEDDLKTLATTRGLNVKEYLVNVKKINTSRIFLIGANTISSENRSNEKNSIVKLELKTE